MQASARGLWSVEVVMLALMTPPLASIVQARVTLPRKVGFFCASLS